MVINGHFSLTLLLLWIHSDRVTASFQQDKYFLCVFYLLARTRRTGLVSRLCFTCVKVVVLYVSEVYLVMTGLAHIRSTYQLSSYDINDPDDVMQDKKVSGCINSPCIPPPAHHFLFL